MMKAQTKLVASQGLFQIYTAYYASPAPQGTIILVNGSLATTASFSQTVRYLQPHFNVVLFDEPYAGQSKMHNTHSRPLTKEQEAHILLDLIEHFQADHLLSFSWGGASAMLALAQRPPTLRKAVIMGFSPVINAAMRDYLETGMDLMLNCERCAVAELVNRTIGQHLPSLFKRYNFRHISSLDDHEYLQMAYHVRQVLTQNVHCYLEDSGNIDIPLLFVNGALDAYTTPEDARLFSRFVSDCQFATIPDAGHFLDAEHKFAWQHTSEAVMGFLKPDARRYRSDVRSSSLDQPLPQATAMGVLA